MQQSSLPHMLCALGALLGLVACHSAAPAAPPRVEYQSNQPTADGLYLARSAPSHTVYLRPGAQIRRYTEVIVDPFMVSYAMSPSSGDQAPAPVRTLDPYAEARLTGLLRDDFLRELSRSQSFRVVETPGPMVLRVQGWIYDLEIEEPYRQDPRNFPLCFGKMNLILNVRDSLTAQALARVSDHIAVSCTREHGELYYEASWKDMKGMLHPWASFLSDSLDELHEIADLPAAPGESPPAP